MSSIYCPFFTFNTPLRHPQRYTTRTSISTCSCPGCEHPGSQSHYSAVDIFEAEQGKVNPMGQVASHRSQFAPFKHDYVYLNDMADEWTIVIIFFNISVAVLNSYYGVAMYVRQRATPPSSSY
jgi:Beta-glucan synthesis-associated protein SKN1/KRE6/Sbg1